MKRINGNECSGRRSGIDILRDCMRKWVLTERQEDEIVYDIKDFVRDYVRGCVRAWTLTNDMPQRMCHLIYMTPHWRWILFVWTRVRIIWRGGGGRSFSVLLCCNIWYTPTPHSGRMKNVYNRRRAPRVLHSATTRVRSSAIDGGLPRFWSFRELLCQLYGHFDVIKRILSCQAVMVGDDINSDVGGAQKCGIRGVLVKTGKYTPQNLNHPSVKPDLIAKDLFHAVDSFLSSNSGWLPVRPRRYLRTQSATRKTVHGMSR